MATLDFTVCIPTYRREALLQRLLLDISSQHIRPNRVIIVDGDPLTGKALRILTLCRDLLDCEIIYIPSNHANASYQRYLAALYRPSSDIIVYLDDDLRIKALDTLGNLLIPFTWSNSMVVGVTGSIEFPNRSNGSLVSPIQSVALKIFAYQGDPGGLTPTGNRILPNNTGENYADVTWLRGGVMAFKMDAVQYNPYYPDVFAMGHIGCGLGVDDTFISRWASQYGRLLLARNAIFYHTDEDDSKAYPAKGFGRGYAATYSRRFLNDHYRINGPPTRSDRWALLKSYAGNVLLAWSRAVTQRSKTSLALARGTTLGAIHGLTRPPTAKRLTPDIDWWGDAEKALEAAVLVQQGERL